MLQCVAVYCIVRCIMSQCVLQGVMSSVMLSSLDCVAERVAVCCSVFQCSEVSDELRHVVEFGQCCRVCCSVLQCVAVFCSD